MKVLVPGASGFIGRNLVRALPRDAEILALYHRSKDFPDFLLEQGLSHIRPVQVDLADADQVWEKLGPEKSFDAIFFLAANGNPSLSVELPAFDLQANTLTVVNLLEVCTAGDFIYMSSGAVYDGLVGPASPTAPLSPRLPYAVSKLATEYYLHFFHEWRGQLERLTILRFFGAFGPYEPPRKIYTRLVRAFAWERKKEFEVRGDGTNLIDAMYVDDVVAGLLKVWQSQGEGGVFDYGSGEPLTIDELVRRAAGAFGNDDVKIVHQDTTAEPIHFTIDPQPFAQRFSFQRQFTLEEGLQSMRTYMEKEGWRDKAIV